MRSSRGSAFRGRALDWQRVAQAGVKRVVLVPGPGAEPVEGLASGSIALRA
jgi:hypothetical protein